MSIMDLKSLAVPFHCQMMNEDDKILSFILKSKSHLIPHWNFNIEILSFEISIFTCITGTSYLPPMHQIKWERTRKMRLYCTDVEEFLDISG